MRLFLIALQLVLGGTTPAPGPTAQTYGQAVADQGNLWNFTNLMRLGGSMSSTANEYGVTIQCFLQPTQGTAPYEKICLIPWVTQTDPSDYVNGRLKDGVPIDARCYIDGNNPTGRCWGAYFEAGVHPGSDGVTTGVEIGGNNQSKDQPLSGQTNSKALLSLVAGENGATAPITGFARMVPGSQSGHWGFIAESAAFVDPVNSIAFGTQSNTNGLYTGGIQADGSIFGTFLIPLINTAGLNASLLPTMKPNETFYWGDTSTGQTYITHFDGTGYALVPVAKYIKAN